MTRATNKQIKLQVDDTAFGESWDGSLEAVSKNALYDVISTIEENNTGVNTGDQDISGIAENAAAINTLEINNTGINTGDQDISGIDANAANISTNEGNISTNSTNISSNTSRLITNEADIITNAGNISSNSSDIVDNTSNISVNAGNISNNAGDISNNSGDILSNSSSISTLESNNTGTSSGVNTGDQDLSGLALKSNVLEKDNTSAYTPTLSYHPATKDYVDSIDVGVSKIIAGSGVSISPGNGEGDVTINVEGSNVDYSEWATYIGTRLNDDLVITIGDYDSSGNGTTLKINDNLQKVIASKLIQAESGIISDSNNGIILNNLANTGKVTLKASSISSSSDVNLEVQDVDGVIALISDISGIAVNTVNISTNASAINTLEVNNTGVNTGDQDISGIAINASAINTLEINNTGVNTGDQDISGIIDNANAINILEINNTGVNTGDQDISGIAVNADAINTLEINNTGVNTGDQDLSGLAEKVNVLELDNATVFTPTADYHPATKKYVDDSTGVASVTGGEGISVDQTTGAIVVNNDNSEWANFTGTKLNNLDVKIGDFDNSNNGTHIQIDDDDNTINLVGLTTISDDLTINDSNIILNDGQYTTTIGSNLLLIKNVDLKFPTDDGTLALKSQVEDIVSDEAYDDNWNGVSAVSASKNAIYDKIETLLIEGDLNLQLTLAGGNSATSLDSNSDLTLDISNNSYISFEKVDNVNDIEYGILINSATSELKHQVGDSLGSVSVTNGEVNLITYNKEDGLSKTILNIPTAATDGYEFKVILPRPNLSENTEISMPISINGNYADEDGNIEVSVQGGVQSIIAGAGISINPTGGIGNVVITSTATGTSPVTTKGDLYTYDTAAAKLEVGADDYVLTADSSTDTGLAWKAVSSGGGIQSLSGDGVNNSDPLNPIMVFPNLENVTAEGNSTTQGISLINSNLTFSNNSFSSVFKTGSIPFTQDVTLTVPNDVDGTLALTSDIPTSTDGLPEGSSNLYNQIPTGGTVGQVLAKASSSNLDLEWIDAGGGSTPSWQETMDVSSSYYKTDGSMDMYVDEAGSSNSNYFSFSSSSFNLSLSTATSSTSINMSTGGFNITNSGPTGNNFTTQFKINDPVASNVDINLNTPSNAASNSSYTIPLSVNGSYADANGNITISAEGGGTPDTYFETGTVGSNATVGIGNNISIQYDPSNGQYEWTGGDGFAYDENGRNGYGTALGIFGDDISIRGKASIFGSPTLDVKTGENTTGYSGGFFSVGDISWHTQSFNYNGEQGIWYCEIPDYSLTQMGLFSDGIDIDAPNTLSISAGSGGGGDGITMTGENGTDIRIGFEMDGSSQFGDFKLNVHRGAPGSASDNAVNTIGAIRFDANYMYYNNSGVWMRFANAGW